MDVTILSLSEVRGEVRIWWECRVLAPAFLWVVPTLSRAGCLIEYIHEEFSTVRPSFWPASLKDGPLDLEMPSHTDQPGMRSLKDEANRCWDMAFEQMEARGEWLRLMGAARCMANTLLMPFQELTVMIRFENDKDTLETMLLAIDETPFPETRLLGFKLAKDLNYNKPIVPGWAQKLL
jgi:hypothetical protein